MQCSSSHPHEKNLNDDECNLNDVRKHLESIVDMWNEVPTIGNSSDCKLTINSLITVDEAFSYFRSQNLCLNTNLESVQNARVRWKGFMSWIRTPPKLNIDLKGDYNLICCISQCAFSWEDSTHCQMVQTVYKRLTGASVDCPKFGSHWQKIGFQGCDPSTDLRGVGLLGLLQLLYLSTNTSVEPLAKKLYEVSNSETQPFPLAVLSLNVTQIALNALRSGKLNKDCNTRQAVLNVLNFFYIAILDYIYNIWVTEHKTIKDSGYLLKDAEKYCCKSVRKYELEKVKGDVRHSLMSMNNSDLELLYKIAMMKFPKQMPVPEISLTPEQTRTFFLLELGQSAFSIFRVMHLLQILDVIKPILSKLIESMMEEQKHLFNADELLTHILQSNVVGSEDSIGDLKCGILRSGKKFSKFS